MGEQKRVRRGERRREVGSWVLDVDWRDVRVEAVGEKNDGKGGEGKEKRRIGES